jgi:hypothetical protein
MSEQSSKTREPLMWMVAIVVCIGIATYSLLLRSQAVALERERDSFRALLLDQQQRKQRLEALVTQARAIQAQQSVEMKELKQLQQRITTRDQFLVTNGEKIVRQLAVYAPSGERRMLFYVPAGEHRLVYAIREALGSSEESYSVLATWGNDHRRIPNTIAVNLLGDTIYELRTRVEKSMRTAVTIELIGPENKLVHEDALPLSYQALEGLSNLQNDSEVFASYPNELRSVGEAKSHVDTKKSAPVTPLLTFTIDQLGGKDQNSKGRVKMRFWIDSASKPCMSDISVAVNYEFLAINLRSTPQQGRFEGFAKTFQPYEGSGRYFFVDDYFADNASQ